MKEERNIITMDERYRCNRHDRVGNLRTVRGYCPDGSGWDKGSLQKRSFERI